MKIPDLSIDTVDGLIELEQQNGLDEPDRIQIHPLHLRYMAETTGLIREMSASEADALRMCEERGRRLLALKARIDHLASYLALSSDHERADLAYETDYAAATADVCEAYCADISAGNAASVTPALPPVPAVSRGTSTEHRHPVPTVPSQLELAP